MSSLLVETRAHHDRESIARNLAAPGRSPAEPRLSRRVCFSFSVGRGLALRLPINPPFDYSSGPRTCLLHTTDRHGDDAPSSRFNGESNLRLIVVLPPVRRSTTLPIRT